jgi:hypothetical protein
MLADMAGSRPAGDPGAVEALARTIRREAAMLTAVDIADTGTWRGFGADQAKIRLHDTGATVSAVGDELRQLAATLDRMADDLRADQRAWDKAQEEKEKRNAAHP